MNSEESPFYLTSSILKKLESLSNKAWFKKAPAGVNKLNSIMKNMAEKAGLTTKFTNRSERKTMMQTLVNQNFPPTDIIHNFHNSWIKIVRTRQPRSNLCIQGVQLLRLIVE